MKRSKFLKSLLGIPFVAKIAMDAKFVKDLTPTIPEMGRKAARRLVGDIPELDMSNMVVRIYKDNKEYSDIGINIKPRRFGEGFIKFTESPIDKPEV